MRTTTRTHAPSRPWGLRRGTDRPSLSRGRDGRRRGRGGGAFAGRLERQQLLAVDGHVARGVDAEANLAPVDVHDGDTDVVTDVDFFTELAAEDQHGCFPPSSEAWLTSCRILRHEW